MSVGYGVWAVEYAYVEMLKVHSTERHTRGYQSALAHMRDFIADARGRDPEDIQNEFERRAAWDEGNLPQPSEGAP